MSLLLVSDASSYYFIPMPVLLPYGLRKIWGHPANRAPGGLRALAHCIGRSSAWARYQLQKQLGLFPAQGRVIPWIDGLRVRLLASSQQSQACLYYGVPDWPSMQFLRRYLHPGDLCADIGANVGIYSLLLAHLEISPSCAPTCGSIVLIEPRCTTWPWQIVMG